MTATPAKVRAWRDAERKLINEDSPTTVQRQLLQSPDAVGADELRRRRFESRDDADDISSSHGDVSFVQRSDASDSTVAMQTATSRRQSTHRASLPSVAPTTYAVKRVRIRWPKALDTEMAYRELRILLQLRRLADRGLCANFVRVVEWFKGSADVLLPAKSPSLSANSRQYMYYVLEFCDTTLDKKRDELSMKQVKSIAFQLLYALYVAQGENEFAHLDLHMKNILLQTLDARCVLEYDVGGRVHRCDSFMVKIADFGLSRITLDDGQVLSNNRQALSDFFDVCKRADIGQIETHLARVGKRAAENDALAGLVDVSATPATDGANDWQLLSRLRGRMRNGDDLGALLDDDYFDSLRAAAKEPLPEPAAAAAAAVSRRRSTGRKSLGAKTTAVEVSVAEAAVEPDLRRFAYRPRVAAPATPAAIAAALQPHTTQRRRTRSVVKEERACVTEKIALRRSTASADENAENDGADDLTDVRKRLSFEK